MAESIWLRFALIMGTVASFAIGVLLLWIARTERKGKKVDDVADADVPNSATQKREPWTQARSVIILPPPQPEIPLNKQDAFLAHPKERDISDAQRKPENRQAHGRPAGAPSQSASGKPAVTKVKKPKKRAQSFLEEIENLDQFSDAHAWAKENGIHSASEFWGKSSRPDWMMRIASLKQLKLDETKQRLFACDCAEQILPVFEQAFPQEKRPRLAIDTARRFALGEATKDELLAAETAADAAASATGTASGVGAWAVRNAIGVAAWAAKDVAKDNIGAAWIAARSAVAIARNASSVARAESWSDLATDGKAASDAGSEASASAWKWANTWQADRLRFYFPNPFDGRGQ